MARRILVTGGAGFTGAHACKALARAGHEPVVFDDLSNGHREAVRWGALEEEQRMARWVDESLPALTEKFLRLKREGENSSR